MGMDDGDTPFETTMEPKRPRRHNKHATTPLVYTVIMLFSAFSGLCIIAIPSIAPPAVALNEAMEDRLLLDPSEFFQGSKPRPKLEIVSPVNGEILETSEVHIHLTVRGYGFPSNLRDSRVCLGLATKGERVIEECFDQSYDAMQFHATNLVPGGNYMLRVVLFERAQSLAVSVRSFRVGAIALPSPHRNNAFFTSLPSPASSDAYEDNNNRLMDATHNAGGSSSYSGSNQQVSSHHSGANTDKPMIRKGGVNDSEQVSQENLVTIQTALKLALARHTEGRPEDAEKIYKDILEQHPDHAEVLHLLGLVHYQKGDPLSAITYIEKAIFCASEASQQHIMLEISATGDTTPIESQEQNPTKSTASSGSTDTTTNDIENDPSSVSEEKNIYTAGVVSPEAIKAELSSRLGLSDLSSEEEYDGHDIEAAARHAQNMKKERQEVDKKMLHGEGGEEVYLGNKKPKGDRSNFLNSLGECLRAAGRPIEAIRNFNSALQLNPKLATAKFNLALTLQQLGDLEKAMLMYGEVVEMALNNAAYDELDENDVVGTNDNIFNIDETSASGAHHHASSSHEENEDNNDASTYEKKYFASKGIDPLDSSSSTTRRNVGVNTVNENDVSLPRFKDSVPITTTTNELTNAKPRRFKRRLLVPEKMIIEAKIRECDLMVGSGDLENAKLCWEKGLTYFPNNPDMLNELGSVLVQLGDLTKAADAYEEALELGKELSGLNLAIVLEMEGSTTRSIARYQKSLDQAISNKLPHRHIQILMATALPRVLPTSLELRSIREQFSIGLDTLLDSGLAFIGDTAEPLHQGFSTGYHLLFHGENNRALKSKLSRVYMQYCPPLSTGVFMSTEQIIMGSALSMTHTQQAFFEQEDYLLPSSDDVEITDTKAAGGNGGGRQSGRRLGLDDVEDNVGKARVDKEESSPTEKVGSGSANQAMPKQQGSSGKEVGRGIVDKLKQMGGKLSTKLSKKDRPIRVGFISRYFFKHPVGFLSQGIIASLPRPKFKVLVFKIESSAEESVDEVSQHIENHADDVFQLPGALNAAADIIRQQKLHVLVFPEVSADPVTYFLAFSKLAPVQMVWWGHPETTGIPAMDYFISSDIEVAGADAHYSERLVRFKGLGAYFYPPEFSCINSTDNMLSQRTKLLNQQRKEEEKRMKQELKHERQVKKEKNGIRDINIQQSEKEDLETDNDNEEDGDDDNDDDDEGGEDEGLDPEELRTIEFLQRRSKIRGEIMTHMHLPSQFHFYLCPQALFKFHPLFDDILVSIMEKDKLAYFLILDSRERQTWMRSLMDRIAARFASESSSNPRNVTMDDERHARELVETKFIFYAKPVDEDMSQLYESADVVLDTYPIGSYITSLQALAVGSPVVTLASDMLGGRFTLAMYKKMNLYPLRGIRQTSAGVGNSAGASSSGSSISSETGSGGGFSSSLVYDLVATSTKDYVSKALKIAFANQEEKILLRRDITSVNYLLFEDDGAIRQWDALLTKAADGRS